MLPGMTRPTILNQRHPIPDDNFKKVYVGRPTTWGNPFVVGPMWSGSGVVLTREEAIARFRIHAKVRLANNAEWLDPLLDAEYLICWCAPKSCHADILADMIEEMNANRS